MFKFSKRSEERMKGVNPILIEIAHEAISISKIDFGIPSTGGVRSEETQYQLYKDGFSKADGKKKKSKHQSGRALDVFAYVDGKASWKVEYFSQIACAFLQAAVKLGYKIQWGGLWKNFTDMPHFEIIHNYPKTSIKNGIDT